MTTHDHNGGNLDGAVRLDERDGVTPSVVRRFGDGSVADESAPYLTYQLLGDGRRLKSLYQRQYPERLAAHRAVKLALLKGLLVKPWLCEKCAQVRRLEAHHSNYKRPLKVRWLCRRCHTHIHYKTQKNNPSKTWRWEISATASDITSAMKAARR